MKIIWTEKLAVSFAAFWCGNNFRYKTYWEAMKDFKKKIKQ